MACALIVMCVELCSQEGYQGEEYQGEEQYGPEGRYREVSWPASSHFIFCVMCTFLETLMFGGSYGASRYLNSMELHLSKIQIKALKTFNFLSGLEFEVFVKK